MFTSVRITSVAYYETQDEVSRKESLQYYTDNGANDDEARGVWWTPERPAAALSPFPPNPSKPLVQRGATVESKQLHRLAAGKDPETGDLIIQGNSSKRTVGYDCQLSAPKSVSVLWALARDAGQDEEAGKGEAVAKAIEAAHQRANERAMQYAFEQGLIVSRRGKGGKEKEAAAEVAAARYTHHTSRAGDPQLHTHNVLMNVCRRSDGTTGTIDNAQMLRYQGAIAAIYRAELASELKRTLGVSVTKDERNFKVDGVSDELVKTFSKRRNTIEKAAEDMGLNGTAGNREAAKLINFHTRQDKSEQPPLVELYGRWRMEANAKGWHFNSLLESVQDAAAKKEREAEKAWREQRTEAIANGRQIEDERPAFDLDELKERAFAKLTEHNSTFEYRTLCREVFEELQVHVSANDALAILEKIEQDGQLVRVGEIDGEPVYSTPEIIERERAMLRTATGMKENLRPFDPALVERIIAAGRPVGEAGERAQLRAEQAEAVRHILGGDQLAVMEGRAGAGKSFTLGAVTDAAKAAGFTVHGLAPSWKATGVLKEDTKLADEYARAIQGWINRVEKGEIPLSPTTMIIVDEAGMVGLDHMASLVAAAERSGARLILSGDSRQLQPVAAGAPMAAISRLNGSAVLAEIARQKVSWQREASVAFSTGKATEAMAEYDKWGQVKLAEDGDTAMTSLLADYTRDMAEKPEATRLILASTNADATSLNDAVREHRRELGEITGEEIVVETISRGKNGRLTELGFGKGDRIILGETLTLNDVQYVNNSTGTLLDIRKKDGGEAVFHIRWDDGRTLVATESELVGYREKDGSVPAVPKLAHAYAMTVHASQGQTVDACYVYNGRGMGLESTYVSMTRHRHNATMYVDASRIHDELAAKDGRKLSVMKGSGGTKEQDNESETPVTIEDIKKKLYSECGKSEAKKNVCDFQGDVREWIGDAGGAPSSIREKSLTNGVEAMAEEPQTHAMHNVRGLGRVGVRPPPPPIPTVAQFERQRMEQRANAPTPRAVPKPKKPMPGTQSRRVTAEEINVMVRHDLRAYLEKDGVKLADDREPIRKLSDGGTEYTMRYPQGGKVVVTQTGGGNWMFFNRDSSAKGDIRNYVQWRDGRTYPEALHKLRDDLRTQTNTLPSYSPQEVAPKLTLRERFDKIAAERFDPAQFEKLRQWWDRAKEGVNTYLLGRGITAETQQRFASEIRTEPSWSKQNPGGAMFAVRNLDGELVGFTRKGPRHSAEDKRDFSASASGTDYRLSIMGEQERPTRIYAGETAIDALSLYQLDGSRPDAMVTSMAGAVSYKARADLFELAKKHPKAEWHIATDNDKEGRVFESQIAEAIREGNPSAAIVDRRPGNEFKDWNDQLRNRPRDMSAELKSKAEDARRKAEADQRRREEEERRRREEANRPPEYRGPRM